MTRPAQSITVEQYKDQGQVPDRYEYRVTGAVNITTPKIGARLDEDQVNALIDHAKVKATIRPVSK